MREEAGSFLRISGQQKYFCRIFHAWEAKEAGGEREERRIRHAGFGFNFCANDAFAEEPSEKEAYVIVLRSPQVRHPAVFVHEGRTCEFPR